MYFNVISILNLSNIYIRVVVVYAVEYIVLTKVIIKLL